MNNFPYFISSYRYKISRTYNQKYLSINRNRYKVKLSELHKMLKEIKNWLETKQHVVWLAKDTDYLPKKFFGATWAPRLLEFAYLLKRKHSTDNPFENQIVSYYRHRNFKVWLSNRLVFVSYRRNWTCRVGHLLILTSTEVQWHIKTFPCIWWRP